MAVTLEQVRYWLVLDRSIGHVLMSRQSGWHYTLCGMATPNGEASTGLPAKVCRKCRERLRQATLRQPEEQAVNSPTPAGA